MYLTVGPTHLLRVHSQKFYLGASDFIEVTRKRNKIFYAYIANNGWQRHYILVVHLAFRLSVVHSSYFA